MMLQSVDAVEMSLPEKVSIRASLAERLCY